MLIAAWNVVAYHRFTARALYLVERGARALPLLPAADLVRADQLLSEPVLQLLSAAGPTDAKALELVRVLAGASPSALEQQRAVLVELADQGYQVPEIGSDQDDPGSRVDRFCQLVRDCTGPPRR